MGRTKLIVREVFQGEQSLEELIAPLILAHPPLTDGSASVIIESTWYFFLTEYQMDKVMSENELTGEVLSQLMEWIEIGHIVKVGNCKQQEVTIYYRFIGAVEDN